MSSTGTKIFHLCIVIYNLCLLGYFYLIVLPELEVIAPEACADAVYLVLQYASLWALLCHGVYFHLALLEDLLELSPMEIPASFLNTLHKYTDLLFTCYTVPSMLTIQLNFWLLIWQDPGNIDPFNVLGNVFSYNLNHMTHTYPGVINLIELCTHHRQYPKPMKTGFKHPTGFLVLHYIILGATLPFSVRWTYPFYAYLTPALWICFILGNVVVNNFMYYAGSFISQAVWEKTKQA